MYVNDGVAAVESPNVPSPLRSHEYVSASPSGSVDVVPLKLTVSGVGPWSGVAVARAVGEWLPAGNEIRWIVPSAMSA